MVKACKSNAKSDLGWRVEWRKGEYYLDNLPSSGGQPTERWINTAYDPVKASWPDESRGFFGTLH